MTNLNGWERIGVVFLFSAGMAIASPAQTFTTVASFNGTDGANPYFGFLVQGTNGNFYGTTYGGGANGEGTVFEITTAGKVTTVHSFCDRTNCADGSSPLAGLILAPNGNLYGTTSYGGANNGGTVFEITPAGKLTTLYGFCAKSNCTDGNFPYAGLELATNGNFYGTTFFGGANDGGTVFEITPAGELTTLYSFCAESDCADGDLPSTGVVQATNGNLYGTTQAGGANGSGTFFELSAADKLTILQSFDGADGILPDGLLQATNGSFYGSTEFGGAYGEGTVFEISATNTLTTLYSFCAQSGCLDGDNPYQGLVQATDANFFGTTESGGKNGYGTVFEINASGKLTTLYSFCAQSGCTDGASPYAGLMQATNGNFYGTTYVGGSNNIGTVFSLSLGLTSFVETVPTSGAAGTTVIILGNGLTGSSAVSFNGTTATFKVVSSSEITATVPAGATSGKVKVTIPSGTLTSNVPFHVLP